MELIFNSSIYNVGDSSDIRLKVWYEHRRNSNNMEYRFKWRMYLSYKDSETPNPYAWYSNNRRFILYLNNGNVYENNSQSSSSGWDTGEITTNWFTVKNKTTGTTPFYFYALDTYNTSWLNYRSNPIQLAIDPAGSTLGSVSGFNIGDAVSIPIYVYNSAYSNQLTVKIGNTTICTRDTQITESGTYTLEFTPQELSTIYPLIDSTLQKEFTFLLKSYDGQTQIGDGYSTKATGNLTESSPVLDSTPTVTITAPVQTPSNTVIKGVSTVSFGISAHSRKKATIVSCKVNKQDLTLVSETTVGDEHYVIYNGSLTGDTDKYYYEIVDSRGQKYNGVYTAYVIDYIPVTFSGTLSRLSSTSSTIKIEYSGNFWAGNFGNGSSGYQNNSLTIDWSYKLASSDTWIAGGTLSPTIDTENNKYSGNTNLTGTYDYDKDYDFKIEYSDLVTTTKEFKQSVIKGLGILELYKTTALINGNLDVTGENSIQDIAVSEPSHKPDLWIQYSKNLFDKDNYYVLNAYIGTNGKITSEINNKTIYIPCEPNTTYTITKMVASPQSTNRFRIGTTSTIPSINDTVSGFYNAGGDGGDVTTCTYTTNSSAKYLAITVINRANSTTTLATMLASLQIQRGSEATPYEEYLKPSIYVYDGGEYVPISFNNNSIQEWNKIKGSIFAYSSWNSTTKTAILTTSSDLSNTLYEGMKVKIIQNSAEKYAFITSVSSNQITLFMGQNYLLGDASIEEFYYSGLKTPYGFPLEKNIWTLEKVITSNFNGNASVAWQNLGNLNLTIPVGLFNIKCSMRAETTGNGNGFNRFCISTQSNNSDDIYSRTQDGAIPSRHESISIIERQYKATQNTTIYGNVAFAYTGSNSSITLKGESASEPYGNPSYIRATIGYL